MRELLNKINEYGLKKNGTTLSLVMENDESGILIPNVFDAVYTKPFFEFDSLKELEEEIS
tara:strand:+ start:45 stop:224 length:180 start_codon:yes stop_codon:yes gene_type:complete